ncbi:type III-A CRISPR-associated RAMP protein Csm4 [Nitrospira sp. Kam-Ns4a]
MQTLRARVMPQSAFGTPPLGDTLFGQLCWAIRNRFGEQRLTELLAGYTQGRPFLVVSDAFPSGYVPQPSVPGHWFAPVEGLDRKQVKKRQWMPVEQIGHPLTDWLRHCVTTAELPGGWFEAHLQPHNSIDRRTGTTGPEAFAPYTMPQAWIGRREQRNGRETLVVGALDLYVVLDEERIGLDEVRTALADVGALGFGRDASIGLGRFAVEAIEPCSLPAQPQANAWMTLAPCAPQGQSWQADRCFYTVFTRFGRHGDVAVLHGQPFKTPVLLAAAGAVLTPTTFEPRLFIGQGLGGDGSLSKAVPQTVHQGYAPVIGVRLADPGGAA